MRYTIFLNDAEFTATQETVDQVESAIIKAGWKYNDSTGGFESPEYRESI